MITKTKPKPEFIREYKFNHKGNGYVKVRLKTNSKRLFFSCLFYRIPPFLNPVTRLDTEKNKIAMIRFVDDLKSKLLKTNEWTLDEDFELSKNTE